MFKIKHQSGEARLGELKTRSGKFETPFFMPVATMGSGKCISTDDYKEIGARNIICNSLVLSMAPGVETIKNAGGIHKFINYDGCIFTDCGGFQASRSMYLTNSSKGLHFLSPFNGKKHVITPERIMNIQMDIGCDVAMMLDSMSGPKATREEFLESINKTHRWAKECVEYHTDKKQLLFGICQGGFEPDLRKKSAEYISSLEFDGIAIGGLAIGETKQQMHLGLESAIPYITKEKPRYVMGVGNPVDILDCIELGVDCFDSVYPTKNARHDMIFTFDGILNISQGRYKNDNSPMVEGCDCHVCKSYSKAYIHHLTKIQEPAGKRFKSYHNIYFMQRFIEKIREAIKEDTYSMFKKDFVAKWKNI
ncbi:MAG: tRNA guanosine(34) transglycosylase Tgt [Candidatus Woesearchaeota archaeon]